MSILNHKAQVDDQEIVSTKLTIFRTPCEHATPDDISHVLNLVGRCVVGGYGYPKEFKDWLLQIPLGVIVFTRKALESIASNSPRIVEEQALWAVYVLTGYTWIFECAVNHPLNPKKE